MAAAAASSPPVPSKARWYDTTISGAVSGFAATYAKQPVQRLKWIRQVDPGAPVPYATVLRRTLERDGVLGLFRGSLAAISRNVPHSALVYTIFPHFEQLVIDQQARAAATSIPMPPMLLSPSLSLALTSSLTFALTPTLALAGNPADQPRTQPQPQLQPRAPASDPASAPAPAPSLAQP